MITRVTMLEFIGDHAPDWYYEWCEREGSWSELEEKYNDLMKRSTDEPSG